MLQCLAFPPPPLQKPPPPPLGFAKIRLVWRGGGERKERGKWAQRSEPLGSQAPERSDWWVEREEDPPRVSTHDGPRPIAETRGDLDPRSLSGREGRAGWSAGWGGSWDDRLLLPREETLFHSGFLFCCRHWTLPAPCKQKGGGRKRLER